MKRTLLIIAVLAISMVAFAQKPPKQVTDNFTKKFAAATKVEWGQEEENEWEAEFKMNGKEMSAAFDKDGKWLETESKLQKSDLPENALSAVSKEYNGWKIKSVESIETPEMKAFELGIEKGKEELEITVTADGKITVNKESEEKDDEK